MSMDGGIFGRIPSCYTYAVTTLPTERFGIRLKVLGKTRSGKSNALRRLLTHLLPLPWARIVVLDGKRDALAFVSAYSNVTYLNSLHLDRWAEVLTDLAAALPARYAALDAGQAVAPILLVADEIQVGTRHPDHKQAIRDALITLAEQSGALGDCLILASQRPQHAIPLGAAVNCNASLTLLGLGYFHFQADGERAQVGRVKDEGLPTGAQLTSPPAALPAPEHLAPSALPPLLGSVLPPPTHGRVTLYTGEAGSGLTHHLHTHPSAGRRTVVVDWREQSHKVGLTALLTQCNAVAPPQTTIGDLTAMCALALAAEPTLLLLDNAHLATDKVHASLGQIIPYAAETALVFATPVSATRQLVFQTYLTRARRVELTPLRREAVENLADQHLDPAIRGADRQAAVRHIARQANGHPKTVVHLAQNVEHGTLRELREVASGRERPSISLLWLVLTLTLAILLAQRWQVDSYTATVLLLVAYFLLRPLVARLVRQAWEK